jgi:hypothetical protein
MKLIEHRRSPQARAWLQGEIRDQQQRYREISHRMNDELAPARERRYLEFLERCQTRGYSVTGDQLRKLSADEIPQKPRRKSRVVF